MIQGEIVEINDTIATVQLDPISLTFLDNGIPEKAASALAYFPKHNAIGPKIGDAITAGRGRWNCFAKMIVLEHINIIETNMEIDITEKTAETIVDPNTEPTQPAPSNSIMKMPAFSRPPPNHQQPHTSQSTPLTLPEKSSPPEGKRTIQTPEDAQQAKRVKPTPTSKTKQTKNMHGHSVMVLSARPTTDKKTKPYGGLLRTDRKPWDIPATTAIWSQSHLRSQENLELLANGLMAGYTAVDNPQHNELAKLLAQNVNIIPTAVLMAGATYHSDNDSNFFKFTQRWMSYWQAGLSSEAYLNHVMAAGDELINVLPNYDASKSCLMVHAPMPEITPMNKNDKGGRLHFGPNDEIVMKQHKLKLTVKGVVTEITDIDGAEYLSIKFDVNKLIHIRALGLISSGLAVDIIKQEDTSYLRFLVESLRNLPHTIAMPSQNVIYHVAQEFFGMIRNTTSLPDPNTIKANYLAHPSMPDFIPNQRQQQVAKRVLEGQQRVYTVAGPAGTGKTRWTAATTLKMVQDHPSAIILLSGENNNTVDNSFEVVHEIATRDPTCGLRPLRVYAPSREHGINRCDELALHNQALNPPLPSEGEKDIYETMRPAAVSYHILQQSIDNFDWSNMDESQTKGARIEVNKAKRQMESIHKDLCLQFLLIFNPSIIVSTLTAAADSRLINFHYDAVFIDEAASAKEMNIVLAIPKMNPKSTIGKLVIIGDRKQLPPVALTQEESGHFMQRCSHERIQDDGIAIPYMFNIYYRMPPQLLRIPSRLFYNGELFSAVTENTRQWHLTVYPFPVKTEPIMIDWVEGEDTVTNGFSRSNEVEANAVLRHFAFLIKRGVEVTSISILCMYEGQRRLVAMKVREHLHEIGIRGHPILVMNVDSMQGLENEFVIVSLVRSSKKCRGEAMPDTTQWRSMIGFLSDLRRTNVALTRARQGLIIVADILTVRVAPQYAEMINELCERHCVRRDYSQTLEQLANIHHTEWYDIDGHCQHATSEPSHFIQLLQTDNEPLQPMPADDVDFTNNMDTDFPPLPSISK